MSTGIRYFILTDCLGPVVIANSINEYSVTSGKCYHGAKVKVEAEEVSSNFVRRVLFFCSSSNCTVTHQQQASVHGVFT